MATLDTLSDRLEAAQGRLRAALLDGSNTTTHRLAIAQIERDILAEHERSQQAARASAQQASAGITQRAAEIAAAVHQRIAATLSPFPIPEKP